jgi:hypothetical protein
MEHWLDDLAKTVAGGMSRRRALKALGGVLAGALAGGLVPRGAEAQSGCATTGKSCTHQKCCEGLTCVGPGTGKFCCPKDLVCGSGCCDSTKADRCTRGKCMCGTNAPCPTGQHCVGGACVLGEGCADRSRCGTGFQLCGSSSGCVVVETVSGTCLCTSGGLCNRLDQGQPACTSDADCVARHGTALPFCVRGEELDTCPSTTCPPGCTFGCNGRNFCAAPCS